MRHFSISLAIFISSISNALGQFNNFNQSWDYTQFVQQYVGGGGGVSVKIENNSLTIIFSAGFSSVPLKTGSIVNLATTPRLPDLVLGKITSENYQASISGGFLVISGTGAPVGGFNNTFVIDLSPYNVPGSSFSPSVDHNFIVTTSVLVSGKRGLADVLESDNAEKSLSVSYFDGLGRSVQNVSFEGSPLKNDIVETTGYDASGRQHRKHLPVVLTGTSGSFQAGIIEPVSGRYIGIAEDFYDDPSDNIADDYRPFSEIIFESSSLNRPLKEYGPGYSWGTLGSDRYVKNGYGINLYGIDIGQEKVIFWRIDGNGLPLRASPVSGYIEIGGYYSSKQLAVRSTKDEEGMETREYVDRNGKVVLKKSQVVVAPSLNNRDHWAMTYYIYDDLGNLRYVIQPELSNTIHQNDAYNPTTSDLDRLAFQYKYDARQRMTHKKMPGAGWIYMVYDKRNRLVLTQDENQRKDINNIDQKDWTFTKYDALNRPVATGIHTADSVLDQGGMQKRVNRYYDQLGTDRAWFETYVGKTSGHLHGYDNRSFPVATDPAQYLTVTYYDHYGFLSLNNSSEFDFHSNELPANSSDPGQQSTAFTRVVGKVTGVMTRMLSTATWLKSVNYYDDRQRLIQQISDHPKGHEIVTTVYDFIGKPVRMKNSLYAGKPVVWTNVANAQVIGETIKGNHTSSWVAGASSLQSLPADIDGWVEFTVDKTTPSVAVGLNTDATGQSYTNIDHCIMVTSGAFRVYEENVYIGAFGNAYPGDVLRVERVNGKIHYKRNGMIVYTSLSTAAGVLFADASLQNSSAQFSKARLSHTFTGLAATPQYFIKRFVYDHASRLLETWHQVNGDSEVLLSKNDYNELGQLVDKKLYSTDGTDFKQSVDYGYNIRGWLLRINSSDLSIEGNDPKDYFGMNLAYNDDLGTGNASVDPTEDLRQFNGNISAMKWSNYLGLDSVKEMAYNFRYDPLNRLEHAMHVRSPGLGMWEAGEYDERDIEYDLNGNIKKLKRRAENGALIDNLVYSYTSAGVTGNKLLTVADNVTNPADKAKGFYDGALSGDYEYDGNGNLVIDKNKVITSPIVYNHLNLPEKVTRANSSVNYLYDATGRKLAQVAVYGNVQKTSEYIGAWMFENNDLQFIQHDEGRIMMTSKKLIFSQDGSDLESFTPTANVTVSSQSINDEGYVKVAPSNVVLTKLGVASIGGDIDVVAGQQYVYRVKGYSNSIRTAYLYVKGNTSDLIWTGANLSSNLAADMWVETRFTVPENVSYVNIGVLYNTAQVGTANDYFYINEVELYQVESSAPEYQYYLKDHLGNVRLTFTTKEEEEVFSATMEDDTRRTEQVTFRNYSHTTNDLFDHTDTEAVYNKVHMLNGGNNLQVGLAKSFSVVPGDTIKAEVYAKYLGTTGGSSNLAGFAAALLSAFGLPAPTHGEIGTASSALDTYGSIIADGGNQGNPNWPQGWLNVLVFDKGYNLVDLAVQQLDGTYVQTGATKMPHQPMSREVYIKEPGYVYIYVSNEGSVEQQIYFDDMNIKHKKSPVVQSDDYYPFGLSFNSYSRENRISNNYTFNSKEKQDELELGWLDFGARMYMPEVGRWSTLDKHSESYFSVSPFVSFANNPLILTDPDGNDILFWQFQSDGEGGGKWKQVTYDKLDKKVQQAIQNFAKTEDGMAFLSQFANKGDKIGGVKFTEDGRYAKHNLNLGEFSINVGAEGYTDEPAGRDFGPTEFGKGSGGYVDLYVNLYTQMDNDSEINYAETLGHEVFLHLNQYAKEYIDAFEVLGQKAASRVYEKSSQGNPNGDRDHLSMYRKSEAAQKYYHYINQLKTVLNPAAVQKHVENERKKYAPNK